MINTTTAIHEAAHAVMAAYVGLPFISTDAIYVPNVRNGATLIGGKFQGDSGRYTPVEMMALFLLAPRAAIEKYTNLPPDLFPGAGSHYEPSYTNDEQQLRELADNFEYDHSVSFETMFERFRRAYLERARDIIAIPDVWKAIGQGAREIQDAALEGKSVSSQRIITILKQCKTEMPDN